jgi:hypothetical protein
VEGAAGAGQEQRSGVPIVPDGFVVPVELVGEGFRLEPLGPEHNESDFAAWTSSIGYIRETADFRGRSWPPAEGMPLERNLADLRQHADDFVRRVGFTYTVIDPATGEVVGCVYIYGSREQEGTVDVRSWVRADRAELDRPLAQAVSGWLAESWPLGPVRYRGQ